MENKISIKAASKKMGCTIQNAYDLIRRLSLKAKRQDGKLYTCDQWIEEYYETCHSKQVNSTFNGRKVFDRSRGEYSIKDAAEMLRANEDSVEYWVRTGRLRTIRKGCYVVVMKKEIERFAAEELVDRAERA